MIDSQKRRLAQKLWGWICLSINALITAVFRAEKNPASLRIGLLLSVSIICAGILKTLADKAKNDLSVTSVIIEYIGLCGITLLTGLKASDYLSSGSPLIALASAAAIELLIFLVITYWHALRHFFR